MGDKILLYQAIAANFVGAILAFFQLQGHYVWPEVKFLKSQVFVIGLSVVIAPLFWYSTKWSFEYFGAFWNYRLLGFGIGVVVFGLCTFLIFDEVVTLKTIISILLATGIIIIQIL